MARSKTPKPPTLDELNEKVQDYEHHCEHFLEANRIAQGVLSNIHIEEGITLRARLEVVVDILEGASIRYTD